MILPRFILKKKTKKISHDLSYVNKKVNFIYPVLMILPSLLIVSLFVFLPLAITISNSIKVKGPSGFFDDYTYGIKNFTNLFQDENFRVSLGNSVLYSFISVPLIIIISIILSASIATLLNKYVRGFWQSVFFLPYVTNSIAISLVFVSVFSNFGFFNKVTGLNISWLRNPPFSEELSKGSRWSVLFVVLFTGVWQGIAFNVLILTTAILSIDKNLYKSASIDGASVFQQFRKITLPSIYKNILFLVTLGAVGSIKVFPLALFGNNELKAITSEGTTLLILLSYLTKKSQFEAAGALSIVVFAISLAMTFIFRVGLKKVIGFGKKIKLHQIEKNFYYRKSKILDFKIKNFYSYDWEKWKNRLLAMIGIFALGFCIFIAVRGLN